LNLKIDLKKNQKSFIVNKDLSFLNDKEFKNQYLSQKFEEVVSVQKKYLKGLKSDQKLIGTFKNKYIRGLNQEDSVIADTETQRQALELSHTS
jgi:Txe/YoeB family toxin of Txe-Axe toxin-antitoxin module